MVLGHSMIKPSTFHCETTSAQHNRSEHSEVCNLHCGSHVYPPLLPPRWSRLNAAKTEGRRREAGKANDSRNDR
eukprot:7668010-Pyramimonas_sp.AAC.1